MNFPSVNPANQLLIESLGYICQVNSDHVLVKLYTTLVLADIFVFQRYAQFQKSPPKSKFPPPHAPKSFKSILRAFHFLHDKPDEVMLQESVP